MYSEALTKQTLLWYGKTTGGSCLSIIVRTFVQQRSLPLFCLFPPYHRIVDEYDDGKQQYYRRKSRDETMSSALLLTDRFGDCRLIIVCDNRMKVKIGKCFIYWYTLPASLLRFSGRREQQTVPKKLKPNS